MESPAHPTPCVFLRIRATRPTTLCEARPGICTALWEERTLRGSFPSYEWFLFSNVIPPSSLRTASSRAESVSMRTG